MRSFCSAKASLIFSTKNFSVFGYKVVKHLTSWPLNKLVKLTMLWTTGPWHHTSSFLIWTWHTVPSIVLCIQYSHFPLFHEHVPHWEGSQLDFFAQGSLWFIYSRTSVAWTLMAHLHCCFKLVLESPGKNSAHADLGSGWFSYLTLKMVY